MDGEEYPQLVLEANSPATTCALHPDEELKFCQECEDLLCSLCQATGGCHHQITEASEAVLGLKCKSLLSKLGGGPEGAIGDDVEKIDKASEAVAKEIARVGQAGGDISQEITSIFQSLHNLLEVRMKDLLNNLDEMVWHAGVPLEDQRNRLFDISAEVKRATDFLRMYSGGFRGGRRGHVPPLQSRQFLFFVRDEPLMRATDIHVD